MPTSTPTPLERLLAEQAARWGAGDRVLAEALIAEHPEVAGDDAALPALKQAEGRLRQTAVETVSLAKAGARPPTDEAPGTGVATVPHVEAATATDERGRPPRLPTIPGYTIKREIKCGGMGAVYEAEQEGLKRRCAIKLMLAGRMAGAAEVARFRAEAEALGQVEHDGVVGVYGWGDHEGLLFLVMEYMPRGSLADRLGGKPMPAEEAAALVKGLAEAVHHVHGVKHAAGVGIIHRDLKPQNILLDAEGRAKVSDFGLARLVGAEGVTGPGDIAGTPGYMAPEQAEDLMRAGVPADVWGLGAVLYACLSGRPPFTGNKVQVLLRARNEAPAPLPAGTPAGLEEIVLKCLEKQPARRYPTAQALADDLGRWLDRQRPQAQLGWLGGVGRWARRNPRRAFLASLLGAAPLAGLGAYLGWGVDWLDVELRRGRGAELFDARGEPRHIRWVTGRGLGHASRARDGAFRVTAESPALVELARGSQRESYRFSCQARHDLSTSAVYVGLYFAHRVFTVGSRTLHFYLELSFSDVESDGQAWLNAKELNGGVAPDGRKAPPLNPLQLRANAFWAPADERDIPEVGFQTRVETFEAAGREHAGIWRLLTVEVTPSRIVASWGDPPKERIVVAVPAMMRAFRDHCAGLPPDHVAFQFDPGFDPTGGLGLLVQRATVAFAEAEIRPL